MCNDPLRCQIKSRVWIEGTKQLDFAQAIHQSSLKSYKFRLNEHSKKRQFQRAIAQHELISIIKHGEIIHHRIVGKYSRSIVLGYLSVHGRPLHVVLEYRHDEQVVEIVTIYDPRTKQMWDTEFKKKICFCDQE